MAYLAFSEPGVGGTGRAPVAIPLPALVDEPIVSLSALEWSVVALARKQSLASLRAPSRIAMAMGVLFGDSDNPRLADPRLEALRRIAVLSWHHGYTVPSHEVRAFVDAGFSAAQYELIVDSISVDRRRRSRGN